MVNWLFKQPGAARAAPPTPPAPRSVPVKTGPTPQQKAEARAQQLEQARAEWAPRLQAALGDDAALLRVAMEAPVVELKLGAIEALAGEDALKQAEREMRNHDRRAHRAAKQRLDAALKQRESRAHAATLLDAARALAGESPIPANRLVALDRAWQALDAQVLEPAQVQEFADVRARVNASLQARGEQEHAQQQWLAQAKRALAELQRACALPAAAGGAEQLAQDCAAAQLLRDSREQVAATAALDMALAAALEAAQVLQARWAEPAPPEVAAPVPEPAPQAPPTVAPKSPRTLSGEQFEAFEALLQQSEEALAQGQLGVIQQRLEAIDALLETLRGARLGDAQHGRLQALHAERGRLKGWQQWGGGRARDDLVSEAEALARATLEATGRPAPAASLRAPAEAAPEVTPGTPDAPVAVPEALVAVPDAPVAAPEAPVAVPDAPVAAPDAPVAAPEAPVAAPEAPVAAPVRAHGVRKLNLKAHADAIQDLRKRWKELDRLGAPANQTLWKRFDAALHAAHEPVAAHLDALKAQREANLATREALLAELDAVPAEPQSQDEEVLAAHWKKLARAQENFQRAWRPLGPLEHTVPAAARNALQQRLRASVERIELPLQAARQLAEGVREQLIERGLALQEEVKQQPQLRDAIARVRELQAQWQHSARQLTLQRGVESALWARFKAATDGVFAQRDAAANARDAELTANLAAREVLLQRLEGLSSTTPTAQIERTLDEVDRAWRAAGEPPRGTLNALEARLRDAHAAALRALSASVHVTWQATCDALAAQLALCEEREAAPQDPEGLAQRWAAQQALPAKLPAAWAQALMQRWSEPVGAAVPAGFNLEDLLLRLESTLDLPASEQQIAARRALKLRALKDTLEGRSAPNSDAAKRGSGLSGALRHRCGDAALRERLHALIAALRSAAPGTLLPPTGRS